MFSEKWFAEGRVPVERSAADACGNITPGQVHQPTLLQGGVDGLYRCKGGDLVVHLGRGDGRDAAAVHPGQHAGGGAELSVSGGDPDLCRGAGQVAEHGGEQQL